MRRASLRPRCLAYETRKEMVSENTPSLSASWDVPFSGPDGSHEGAAAKSGKSLIVGAEIFVSRSKHKRRKVTKYIYSETYDDLLLRLSDISQLAVPTNQSVQFVAGELFFFF